MTVIKFGQSSEDNVEGAFGVAGAYVERGDTQVWVLWD